MKLVIVESPTKAKTIGNFLGREYTVRSSFGHIRDLPKSKTGIDVEHDFAPHYLVPPKAKKVASELKELAKKADEIILATDEDREGEAIAWHLLYVLGLEKEGKINEKKHVQRIVFHEITKSAIKHALETPRDIDYNLVDAQQARRVLDRLVGYGLSPFLWKKVRYGLSAGRVQSVALRLIVEREREIQAFKADEYWTIDANLTENAKKISLTAKLHAINDKKLEKLAIPNSEKAQDVKQDLLKADFKVANIEEKESNRNPSPPFTTSTLQQEASRKFGFSAKQTMAIAQQLYEGIDIGDEHATGLITYMRTDSVNLAQTALEQAQQAIKNHFGAEYALDEPRRFSTRSKGAQEAHEAIRPTDLTRYPDHIKQYLDRNQLKLYSLIWKRAIASQMQPAKINSIHVSINAQNKDSYELRSSGQTIVFDGFIRAYTEDVDEKDDELSEISDALKLIKADDKLDCDEIKTDQHFTEPPARYTDASLIKTLEQNGIGRPSTYAPTITTIQDRGYVEKIDKKFQPTDIGYIVNDLLVENFPEVIDVNFTSEIEESFDDIAEGKKEWVPVIRNFYIPFKQHLDEREKDVEKIQKESTTPCPHCGKMMIIKFGRMGEFLACPDPEVKVTLPMPEEQAKIKELEAQTAGEKCPICGKDMQVKRGRFGFFLGCIDYPNCKGIAKIVKKIGFKCPNCKVGDLIVRKGRGRSKEFYGCSTFPKCTLTLNTKPENEEQLQELFTQWQAKPPSDPTKKKSYARKSKK